MVGSSEVIKVVVGRPCFADDCDLVEALLLLIALTPDSEEFQKLVAFENAFELIFSMIETEGALTHGSEVVEDCLTLLATLLRLNISNQSYFRETGCVKKITKLLADVNYEQPGEEPAPQWTLAHRDKNIWGLMVIIQLFLVKGGINTPVNQMAFWNNGVMEQVLSTAFSQRFNVSVTSKALATCADLIRGNQPLQERFGDVEVVWGPAATSLDAVNGDAAPKAPQQINVIEALLKLSLEPASIQLLDARLAACECIKSFFSSHSGIRIHVLRRAINGHVSGQDDIPNILSVLLTPPELRRNADPYQTWMASVLMLQLLFENTEAKTVAMEVTEGNADEGEEVVTCIQLIVGNLITGMQRGDDERISLGYLMLLCGWLFEEPDAVNDLLGEGSTIQTLLQEIKHRLASNVLLSGLCTFLLGIIYEFSSKDSPIPRKTLHKLLIEQLGREQYIDKIKRFRECPAIRDFEVLPQTVGPHYEGGLPDIFFDSTFVEFLKDHFGRMIRAIDREPGLEISVITNGIQRGISREMVDSLREDLQEKTQTMQKLEADLVALQNQFEHEQLEHRKTKESGTMESSRFQQLHESAQKSHEHEMHLLKEQQKNAQNELLRQHDEQLRAIDRQLKDTSAEYERRSHRVKEHHDAEVSDLQKRLHVLETELARAKEQHASASADLQATIETLKSDADKAREQHAAEVSNLNSTIHTIQSGTDDSKDRHAREVNDLSETIQSLRSEIDRVQQEHRTELDELKSTNEKLHSDLERHQAEFDELKSANQKLQSELEQHQTEVGDLKSAKQKLQTELEKHQSETTELQTANQKLQSELDGAKNQSTQDAQGIRDELSSQSSAFEKRAKEAESKIAQMEADAQRSAKFLEEARQQLEKAQSETKAKEEARQGAQSELEDLLIVFGDLEAKRNEDKVSHYFLFYSCLYLRMQMTHGFLETPQRSRTGSVGG